MYDKILKGFDAEKSLNSVSTSLKMECFFGIKSVQMLGKKKKKKKGSSLWVRDQENIVGVAKSHITCQWDSAVSSWQHVAKQRHPINMWPSIVMKQDYDQSLRSKRYFFMFINRDI